jgi:phospholipid/cholesterol/gamma-HCH transport system ATP-binding protein
MALASLGKQLKHNRMENTLMTNLQQTATLHPKIEFREVSLAFGSKVVLDAISFFVLPGEMKVVLGQSGSGKSTILRLALGLLKPDAGQILINGTDIAQMSEAALTEVRQKMSIVFQEGALFDSLSVYENIAYRPRELGWPNDQIESSVQRVLAFAGLQDVADELPAALSGGTRRMVAIARAMVDQPEIILFDEPTVGLDPPTAHRLCEAAIRLRDLERTTSMFVTHKLADVRYLASNYAVRTSDQHDELLAENNTLCLINTRFLMLYQGKIVFDGTDEELWASTDPFLRSFTSQEEED